MSEKLFIFDLMDTIIEDPIHIAIRKLVPKEKLELFLTKKNNSVYHDFEAGKIEENEYLEKFYLSEIDKTEFFNPKLLKEELFKRIQIIPSTKKLINQLKIIGIKMVLASNYSEWYRELFKYKPLDELLGKMEHLYFSSDLKIRKPDPKFFEIIEQDWPDYHYIYIDDNKKNTQVAQKRKWKTILFDQNKTNLDKLV